MKFCFVAAFQKAGVDVVERRIHKQVELRSEEVDSRFDEFYKSLPVLEAFDERWYSWMEVPDWCDVCKVGPLTSVLSPYEKKKQMSQQRHNYNLRATTRAQTIRVNQAEEDQAVQVLVSIGTEKLADSVERLAASQEEANRLKAQQLQQMEQAQKTLLSFGEMCIKAYQEEERKKRVDSFLPKSDFAKPPSMFSPKVPEGFSPTRPALATPVEAQIHEVRGFRF